MAEAEPNSSAHSYEVLGKLAEGGTTEIFLARAKGVGAVERVVVLKRLKRSVTSHVDLVQVFLDEARLAAQLQHPNIAQVFEVGKLGGSFFYAMEFVNGETLQSLMHHARGKKIQIPVRAVLTIASAIAAGLHHAHDRKASDGQPLAIVHGDLSPTNTLVSQEGIIKLVDFGALKAGEAKGKVSPYSSPEQCRGDALDRRSDLFSLGIVLWELLTLDPLYQRANDDDIKQAVEHEEPVKPSTMRYDVPPELDAMVLKLLAKDPARRFKDADEVLAAIESLAQKLSILLSTADLSRMMRLWFGTKSEPTVDPGAADAAPPLIISSEEIPADLATAHTPIDDQLDSVRSAAALISARATARAGNTTGRQDKSTVPPELMDNPNENFEQIRDRILARARQKKETKQPQVADASGGTLPPPLSGLSGTVPPPPAAAPTPLAAASTTGTPPSSSSHGTPLAILRPIAPTDRHTRATAPAPMAIIEDAVRRATIPDPDYKNGVNGHAHSAPDADVAAEEPDKVVVDEDLTGSRSASGELGNKGTFGIISRHEAKVRVSEEMSIPVEPREAPPATANVAKIETDSEASSRHAAALTTGAAAAAMTDTAAATVSTDAATSASSHLSDDSSQTATSQTGVSARDDARQARSEDSIARAINDAQAEEKAARDANRKQDREDAKADRDRDRSDAKTARADEKASRKRDRHEAADAARTRATARASTADITQPGRRPAWLLPIVAGATLLLVILVVMKLRGGDSSTRAAQPTQAQQVSEPTANSPTAAGAQASDQAAADQAAKDQAAKDQAAKDQAAKDQAAKDQAAKDQAATDQAAKDQAAKDQAAKDQAAKDQAAKEQAAKDQAAKDQAAKDQAAKDQAAKDRAAKDQAAKDRAAKDRTANKDQAVKKDPVVTKEPETKKGIEELFAAGDFAKTNAACTKEIVFTAQKLQMCAEAACQTKNAALAKRWINAIAKASRPDMIAKCKALGVELEAPPAAPAAPPAPAAPAPAPDSAPPAPPPQ